MSDPSAPNYRDEFLQQVLLVLSCLGYSGDERENYAGIFLDFCDDALGLFDLNYGPDNPSMQTFLNHRTQLRLWNLWIDIGAGTGSCMGLSFDQEIPPGGRLCIACASILSDRVSVLGSSMDVDVTSETDLLGWLSWAYEQINVFRLDLNNLAQMTPKLEIKTLEQLWRTDPTLSDPS